MLNAPRIRAMNSAAGLLALDWAGLTKVRQLPLAFFDAISMSKGEAAQKQTDHNVEAAIEEARHMAPRG